MAWGTVDGAVSGFNECGNWPKKLCRCTFHRVARALAQDMVLGFPRLVNGALQRLVSLQVFAVGLTYLVVREMGLASGIW